MGFYPHDYYIQKINLQTKSSKSLPLLPPGPTMQKKLTEALNVPQLPLTQVEYRVKARQSSVQCKSVPTLPAPLLDIVVQISLQC